METLEDVLAGPETEVMDGIQVTKKRWSSHFSPEISTIFLCRPVLTVTTCEPPRALNESRNGLFCQQTFQSQVSKWKTLNMLCIVDCHICIYPRWWDGPDTEGEAAPGDAEVQGERRQVVRRLALSWWSWGWLNWGSEGKYPAQWKWQNIRRTNSLQEISQGQDD